MAKKRNNPEQTIKLPFPLSGLDETRAYSVQREGTTASAFNVRTFDPGTDRARGGARSGQVKFLNAQVNGSNSIQLLDHFDTVASAPPWTYNPFVYSQGSGNGFGLASDFSGASLFSGLGAASGFAFSCSCWDTLGNLYVAQVNTGTSKYFVTCVSPAGSVTWTSAQISCAANIRAVAGMAVIGGFLFLAVIGTLPVAGSYSAGNCHIEQLNAITGATITLTWITSNTTTLPNFSTASSNCLCAIGTTLGCVGYTSATLSQWFTFNGLAAAGTAPLTTITLGTSGNTQAACKVVSDGAANFYFIAPVASAFLCKVALAGTSLTWQTITADTPNSLAYDSSTFTLLALCGTAPCIRNVNITTGGLVANISTDSVIYEEISADQSGNFVIWDNSVASNDSLTLNNGLAKRFGPQTLANQVHTGASVSPIPAPVAASGARSTLALAIAGGTLKTFTSSAFSAVTGGTVFSASANVIRGAQNGIRYFFTDGTAYFYYEPNTSSIKAWTAQDGGTMPLDLSGNTLPLIATFRGRTVLAGQTVWFMSAVNDPFNWNFAPFVTSTTQATFGTVDTQGFPGQTINAIYSYDDNNTIIFGLSHAIWQLTGDPEAGGQFNIVTRDIGMAYGMPVCVDPFGQIYFWGNGFGIFTLVPGSLPVPISMQIDRRIQKVNLATSYVRMYWDLFNQGLGIFVTPLNAATPTTNFFWEKRTNAWQPDFYGNVNLNPLAVHDYRRGPLAADQQIFLGGRDGYIRVLGNGNSTDDTIPIASSVMIGPIPNKDQERIKLEDLLTEMSQTSGPVTYSIFVGETAEEALSSGAKETGTWNAGRNPVSLILWSGIAIYVQISATGPWALEKIMARITSMGPAASRLYLGA